MSGGPFLNIPKNIAPEQRTMIEHIVERYGATLTGSLITNIPEDRLFDLQGEIEQVLG